MLAKRIDGVVNFPNGEAIGGWALERRQEGNKRPEMVKVNWWCLFEQVGEKWLAHYAVPGHDSVVVSNPAIDATGDTPREAFEALVSKWSFMNGGESNAMRELLPQLRQELTDAGL